MIFDPRVDARFVERMISRWLTRQPTYFFTLSHILLTNGTRAKVILQRERRQLDGRSNARLSHELERGHHGQDVEGCVNVLES